LGSGDARFGQGTVVRLDFISGRISHTESVAAINSSRSMPERPRSGKAAIAVAELQ
jgi:hypothetical protein